MNITKNRGGLESLSNGEQVQKPNIKERILNAWFSAPGSNRSKIIQILIALYPVGILWFHERAGWRLSLLFALILAITDGDTWGYLKKTSWLDRTPFLMVSGLLVMNFITIPLVGPHTGLSGLPVSTENIYGALIALTVGLGVRGAVQVRFQVSAFLWVFGIWNGFQLLYLIFKPGFLAGRYVGPYHLNPNIIAMVYLPIVGFNLVHFLHQKGNAKRFLSGAGLALGIVFLYLTKTRFALLTLIFVTIPLAVFLSPPRMKARKKVSLILAGLLIISLVVGVFWDKFEAADRRSMLTVNARIEITSIACKLFLGGPWYTEAIGYGNYKGVFQGVIAHFGFEKPGISPEAPHAHNTFLQLLLENGLMGLALLMVFLAWIVLFSFKGLKADNIEERMVSIMRLVFILTFFVMSQMDYSLNGIHGKMNWFLLGLTFSTLFLQGEVHTKTRTWV